MNSSVKKVRINKQPGRFLSKLCKFTLASFICADLHTVCKLYILEIKYDIHPKI